MQGVVPLVSEFLARSHDCLSLCYIWFGEKTQSLGAIVLTDQNNLSNLGRGSPKGNLWQIVLK